MKATRSAQFWIGVAVSVVCLWLAVRDVPLADLRRSLAGGAYVWLVPAVVVHLIAILARAQRWVVLLELKRHLADSFWAEGIGYLFTNVFPLRLGEPARVAVMAERCRLPFMRVGGSAVVERLLDLATIVVVLILVLPWMQVPILVIRAGVTFGALLLLLVIAVFLLARFDRRVERLLSAIVLRVRFLPAETIVGYWRELVSGLVPLTRWQTALPAVLYSAATWLLSIGMYWCVLRVFEPRSTAVEAAFLVVALSLAVTVPSSPGFVGVFQLVGKQALVVPFGDKYDDSIAFAVVLTAYLVYYLMTTAIGAIGLVWLRQSFSHLGRGLTGAAARREESSGAVREA